MIFASEDIIGSNGTGHYDFTTGPYGDTSFGQFFAIGAIFDSVYQECVRYRYGNCKEWKSYTVFDSFKLASVTVDYTPPQTPPEVPLPAGLALLLSAITGLGIVKRFKRKAAA